MNKLILIMAVAILGNCLVGCTPSVELTPTPTAVVPTVTPTPTPQWTEDEQGAIDAVHKYIEVWIEVTQHLGDSGLNLNRIDEVAIGEHSNETILLWLNWIDRGLHLVGEPSFEANAVVPGVMNSQGQRFDVFVCYSLEHAYLANSDGTQVPKGTADRTTARYEVMKYTGGQYLITWNELEGEEC